MNITRRKLLASALAGCLSAPLLSASALAASKSPSSHAAGVLIPLENLNAAQFKQQLQSTFSVHGEAGAITMRLVSVTEQPAGPNLEHFALLFQGPASPVLPQQIYEFEHPVMGQFAIFIVPVGRATEGIQYEAIFNRLIG